MSHLAMMLLRRGAWGGGVSARHLDEVDGALEERPLLVHLHEFRLVSLRAAIACSKNPVWQ